ncbi:MAG: hypothetical protein EOP49_54310, partial [Sphingobacteriales bacterium]
MPEVVIKRPELGVVYVAPATTTENIIAEIWLDLLQMDRIGGYDDFFQIGGNSLLAVKTVVRLRESFGLELPVTKIYQAPTIAALAQFLDHGEQEPETTIRELISKKGQDVAVIGLAGRFPGAATIEEFWQVLAEGKETTRFFTDAELDASIPDDLKNNPAYVKARGVIDEAAFFDPAFFGINPRVAAVMDPQQRIFIEICWELLEKTGYLPAHFN